MSKGKSETSPITRQGSNMRNHLATPILALFLTGCEALPPDTFVVTSELISRRVIETRRYEGIKEPDLLSACANVLQDLGYNLENSETKLGVITASKQRDATDAGEVVAMIFIAALGGGAMPISKDQTIRVALVARPVTEDGKVVPDKHFVRITFQRVVRRTDNSTYAETLKDAKLYEEFFDKVSKSVFLEAQKI